MVPPHLSCRDATRWTCHLESDWSVKLPRLEGRIRTPYHFRVEKREGLCQEWLRLDPDGTLTIRAGYATDGCSMAPDFPSALPGCVLHDAMRQALSLDPARCPWSRSEADRLFREILQQSGFHWLGSWLYYIGVAGPTGWLYSWIKNWLMPPQDVAC